MIYIDSIRDIILLIASSFVGHTTNMNLLSLGCGDERLRRCNHSAHPGTVPDGRASQDFRDSKNFWDM